VLSVVGALELARTYFVCGACRDGGCPLDERLGITGYVSVEARRLLCLAGGSWSFDQACEHLHALAGLDVSDELIRRVTLGEGPKLAAFAVADATVASEFAAAVGDVEFETDAVKVNTTEKWKDAKIGIFAKRPRGVSASAAEWADRVLPKPTVRLAFAAIEDSVTFAARWGSTAEAMGIDARGGDLTVLGDGADWIWNRAAEQFPNAQGVLDVFHGCEHLAAAAKAYYGEATDLARAATERGRQALLADAYAGVQEWIGGLGPVPRGGDGAALGGMLNYFAGHRERLTYAPRLHRGQSIGSGMVEGAAKNVIGRRLKANNARWRPDNVNRAAGVCCALYSGTWAEYWDQRN
jgi:hypothetical protein